MTDIENFSSDISEYAPELRDLYLTLMPFGDVIHNMHAGPRPQDKPEREPTPYFCLYFSERKDGEITALKSWRIEKDRVYVNDMDGLKPSSMRQLWDFLRQLPRDPYAFTN